MYGTHDLQAKVLAQAVSRDRVSLDEMSFSVACFGKTFFGDTDIDWTLPPKGQRECEHITSVLHALGPRLTYALNTSPSNAMRVPRSMLTNAIPLSERHIRLVGNKDQPGDVVTLDPSEAAVFNPAGCPIGIVSNGKVLLSTHMGRRSLLDYARVTNKGTYRLNESVVGASIRALRDNPQRIHVWLYGSIVPEELLYSLSDNPWAEVNHQILDYVRQQGWGAECLSEKEDGFYLDLPKLARAQFLEYGVPAQNIHTDQGYLHGPTVWGDGAAGKPRNLFVAVRHT